MVSCAAVLGLSGRPHIPEHEAILLLRCQVFIIELSLGRHQVVHLMMRAARQLADKAEAADMCDFLRVGCRRSEVRHSAR